MVIPAVPGYRTLGFFAAQRSQVLQELVGSDEDQGPTGAPGCWKSWSWLRVGWIHHTYYMWIWNVRITPVIPVFNYGCCHEIILGWYWITIGSNSSTKSTRAPKPRNSKDPNIPNNTRLGPTEWWIAALERERVIPCNSRQLLQLL